MLVLPEDDVRQSIRRTVWPAVAQLVAAHAAPADEITEAVLAALREAAIR